MSVPVLSCRKLRVRLRIIVKRSYRYTARRTFADAAAAALLLNTTNSERTWSCSQKPRVRASSHLLSDV